MKSIRLVLILSICIQASAFAVFAQNAIVSFDLSQLTSGVLSDTITASDGTTELTVSARQANDSAKTIFTTSSGLRTFHTNSNTKSVVFNFNTDVILESYRISLASPLFAGDERFILNLSGTNYDENFPVDNSNLTGQTLTFNNKLTIPAGTNLELIAHNPVESGETVYWDRLTVPVVPEPANYALILAPLALPYTALRPPRTR